MNAQTRKLRALMIERRLTCPKVAAICGRTPQTVRRWHCGLVPAPRWALELIALKS